MKTTPLPAGPARSEASDSEILSQPDGQPGFSKLWRRHHDAVFRYVASRVGPASAEEITVDTFATALRARRKFRPAAADGSALPWLIGISTNRIKKHRAAEAKWLRSAAAAATYHDRMPRGGEPEAGMDARLAEAIANLNPRYRDPFLLFALLDMSYEDISIALDVPIGTVRSRISRARHGLAESMGE